MSEIYFKTHDPRHFLMDSQGDLYEVSEELAKQHRQLFPRTSVAVSHVDKEANTIWFSTPLPKEVKVG